MQCTSWEAFGLPNFYFTMAKKTDNALKYLGIAAIAYFLVKKIASDVLNDISFGRPSISIGNTTLTGLNITIKLPVTNNTDLSIPVNAVNADVLYGNNVLSTVFANNSFTVAANNTTEVTFNAVLDYSQFSNSIISLIESREWLQDLKLKGHAVTGGLVFPFEETFTIG